MKETISFEKQVYDKSKPIIVYGVSTYGEIAYHLLKIWNITPNFYCDRAYKDEIYRGIPVIHPKKLDNFEEANIIIASADSFHEIRIFLQEKNVNFKIFDMEKLLGIENVNTSDWSARAKDIYSNKQNYIDIIYQQQEDVNFIRIQYVVSEKCSLKCKDCTHLMQYYKNPQNIDLEKYKESFELLIDTTQSISEVRILGGEPFMNMDTYKLIEWYHDIKKINEFTIYTNGTIIPSENNLRAMARPKVRTRISDYGFNKEQIKRLVDVLEKFNITYFINYYDDWQDPGKLEYKNYTLEEKKEIFSKCYERFCITFFKGQLHRCPRSAHAMNLGAMPDVKADYIDLFHWKGSKEELKSVIKQLQNRDYLEACNYCGGPNRFAQHLPPARQIKTPLPYKLFEQEGKNRE